MKKAALRGLTAIAVALGLLAGVAPNASADMVENTTHPLDFTQFVSCANGGAGEDVHLTGEFHTVFAVTTDGSGAFHVVFTGNSQNLSGVGLTTGDSYRGVDQFAQTVLNVAPPVILTETTTFNLIGQGPGNNLTTHFVFHLTIDANGTARSEVVESSVDCQ